MIYLSQIVAISSWRILVENLKPIETVISLLLKHPYCLQLQLSSSNTEIHLHKTTN